jgi:long-chain acyl-CoA synthetase
MNLALAFSNSVARHADRTAIFWGHKEVSYRQLLNQSTWIARELRQRFNVQTGDRIGLWMKNRPEFIAGLYGALQARGVVVPINHFLKPHEISYILEDSGIDVIITETDYCEFFPELQHHRPQLRFLQVEELPHEIHGFEVADPAPEMNESTLGLIIYTSGTTGHPKGAMLSHGNLLHNVESCRQMLACVEGDRFVLLLPMFHSFMLCVSIFLPTLTGSQIVLIRSMHPMKAMLQEMVARQPSILPAIPQFFRTLTDPAVPVDLPIRICISGAAPLPGQILQDFNQKFSFPLLEGYGLSEASPVVSLNPIKGPWKKGSIGVPIPDVEVRIRNDAGEWLPDGQIGELCVKGGNVMLGYWNQPVATAETLRDGWLLTGDVGYRDTDGYFFITDRKKDMLLVNGINVYPREIEEVLYQFPGIKEAAVVGQPDFRKGEHPVAFVSVFEGMTVDEKALLQFVRDRLADYKVPKRVHFLPQLPRNATGKILKTSLRQRLAHTKSE